MRTKGVLVTVDIHSFGKWMFEKPFTNNPCRSLTLSWRRSLSYRNQSIDLFCKSMDWFLYDRDLRYERVKSANVLVVGKHRYDDSIPQVSRPMPRIRPRIWPQESRHIQVGHACPLSGLNMPVHCMLECTSSA